SALIGLARHDRSPTRTRTCFADFAAAPIRGPKCPPTSRRRPAAPVWRCRGATTAGWWAKTEPGRGLAVTTVGADEVATRPVAVLGCGTMGIGIAQVFAA